METRERFHSIFYFLLFLLMSHPLNRIDIKEVSRYKKTVLKYLKETNKLEFEIGSVQFHGGVKKTAFGVCLDYSGKMFVMKSMVEQFYKSICMKQCKYGYTDVLLYFDGR